VPEVAIRAWPIVSVVNRGGQRNLGRGFTLGRGAAERGAGSRKDSGRLGAHPKNTPATGGQDLEIEFVETHTKFVSGPT
jgi:hypothetical protein